MHRNLTFIGLAAILVAATVVPAVAQDVLISGKVGLCATGLPGRVSPTPIASRR